MQITAAQEMPALFPMMRQAVIVRSGRGMGGGREDGREGNEI